MCGPTADEKSLQASESNLATTLQSNFNTQFANQSDVLSQLNNTLKPTIAAGPSQTGWSAPEAAAVNTNILDTTAANYKNAARGVNAQLAGRGAGGVAGVPGSVGSGSGLASGVDQQIRATIASQGAQQLSTEQNQALQANYAQGNANYQKAVGGANALAGLYNPAGYASEASSANGSAFGQANTIQQQQNQLAKDIAGGATALAGDVFGGIGNLDSTGSSSKGEQVQNFLGGF